MRRAAPLSTRRRIIRHLVAAGVSSLVALSALVLSYAGIHQQAERMRTTLAPSVQGVASTRVSLYQSWNEARRGELDGVGYRSPLLVAEQTLADVRGRQIAGAQGRSGLESVNGIRNTYKSALDDAHGRFADNPGMRTVAMDDAEDSLFRRGEGVFPRLDEVQREQLETVDREVDGGPSRRAGWLLAELSLLFLAAVLLSAHLMLRRRCGRRHNVPLSAALLLTALLAAFPLYWDRETYDALDAARDRLHAMDAEVTKARTDIGLATARVTVVNTSRDVLTEIDSTGGRAALAGWIALAAALTVALPAGALGFRLWRDYEGGVR
ncbi:hypothetical protein [Streptomyces sp. NPDC050504]|uniref:hypothetical protein n=1 Tax=Streptomyces sp. NPDC050504 TaxID=3365618 RepID=UPI0037B161BB